MTEYLDVYDERGRHIGQEERGKVHREGIWHKTVHCWLYDKAGNIYFQRRAEEGKLYTTASGHIQAGETVAEGFYRETNEEIGIKVDKDRLHKIDVHRYSQDLIKPDGSPFRDRAFVNLYAYEFDGDVNEFKFDLNELTELVRISAADALNMFKEEGGEVIGEVITMGEEHNNVARAKICMSDFLVCPGETALGKYGLILQKVLNLI